MKSYKIQYMKRDNYGGYSTDTILIEAHDAVDAITCFKANKDEYDSFQRIECVKSYKIQYMKRDNYGGYSTDTILIEAHDAVDAITYFKANKDEYDSFQRIDCVDKKEEKK